MRGSRGKRSVQLCTVLLTTQAHAILRFWRPGSLRLPLARKVSEAQREESAASDGWLGLPTRARLRRELATAER